MCLIQKCFTLMLLMWGRSKGRSKAGRDQESNPVPLPLSYNYFQLSAAIMLHLLLCSPGNADSEHFENTMASVWVKMTTVWLCFAIYTWTLVAPLILGNCRDFGYDSEWRERRQLLHNLNATFFQYSMFSVVLCCSNRVALYSRIFPYIPAYCAT